MNDSYKKRKPIALLLCCMMAAGCGGISNATGIFITPVVDGLGITQTLYSLLTTITGVGCSLAALLVPHLVLRFGVRPILLIGTLLNSGGYLYSGMVRGPLELFISLVLHSLGYSMIGGTVLYMIVGEWYPERYGFAASLVSGCFGLFAAIISPIVASIIEGHSWRVAYTFIAVVSFVLCLPAGCCPFRLYGNVRSYDEQEEETKTARGKKTIPFRKKSFAFFVVCLMGGSCYLGSLYGAHLTSIGITKGLTLSAGALCASAAMVGNIVSKVINGPLSDRFNPLVVASGMCLIGGLASVGLLVTGPSFALIAESFLFGALYSVSGLSLSLVNMELFGPQQYGFAQSSAVFVCTLVYSMGNLLWGANYDLTGNYNWIMAGTTFCVFLSAIVLVSYYRKRIVQNEKE